MIVRGGFSFWGIRSYFISNNFPQAFADYLTSILASMIGLLWANKIVLAINIGIASSAGLLLYTAFCYVLKLEELKLVADKVQAKLKISRARP